MGLFKYIFILREQLINKMMISKNFMKALEYYFFTTLHLFVAFVLLVGLFYIRFLPRVSRDLWQNMTHYQVFLTLFMLSCIIFNIYNTLKIIGYIKAKEPWEYKKKVLDWLNIIIDYIYAILENFYQFLWFVLEKFINKLTKKTNYLHYKSLRPLVKSFTNPKHYFYNFVILLLLRLLPRIIFVSALVYDVIFCQHFHYTFRCIPLLLIPLLEQFFLFIFKDFHKSHLLNLASFLQIVMLPNSTKSISFLRPGALENLPFGAKDFNDFYDNHFYPTDQILVTVEKYEDWAKTKIHINHINLTLQMLRLIIYIFVLTYGII